MEVKAAIFDSESWISTTVHVWMESTYININNQCNGFLHRPVFLVLFKRKRYEREKLFYSKKGLLFFLNAAPVSLKTVKTDSIWRYEPDAAFKGVHAETQSTHNG